MCKNAESRADPSQQLLRGIALLLYDSAIPGIINLFIFTSRRLNDMFMVLPARCRSRLLSLTLNWIFQESCGSVYSKKRNKFNIKSEFKRSLVTQNTYGRPLSTSSHASRTRHCDRPNVRSSIVETLFVKFVSSMG